MQPNMQSRYYVRSVPLYMRECMFVCVCLYKYIIFFIFFIFFLRSYDHLHLVKEKALLFDANQRPSSPSPFGAGSYLTARLGER